MPLPRFRLRTLMVAVAVAGASLAAMRSPSLLASSAVFTLTVGSLLVALLGIAWGGRRRAFWSGFAVLGWGHLLLAWRNPIGMPAAATVYLMLYLRRSADLGRGDSDFLAHLTAVPASAPDGFVQTGLCLLTLLIAGLGGLVVARNAESRDDRRPPA